MFGRQMWRCVECGTQRQWGHSHPEDDALMPRLLCEGACGPVATDHAFASVEPTPDFKPHWEREVI